MPVEAMPSHDVRKLPVWVMGMANLPLGFVYGFISTAMGILLASRGVSVGKVAAISSIAFSPCAWGFLLSPIVDVRFGKKAYALVFAALAAMLLAVAVLSQGNLTRFTVALTGACLSIVLFSAAVAGLSPDLVANDRYDTLSAWFQVANLGAAGVFSEVAILTVRALPIQAAASVLAMLVLAPTLILLLFPATPKPEGTLQSNFAAMFGDTRRVMREGRLWVGLLLFLLPESCFALTNLFSTMGGDFGVSERHVTTLNGPGVAAVCSLGCLLAIPLCRRFRRRTVYLASGAVAAIVAIGMGLLPRTLLVYAVGLLLYNMCQGFNYTAYGALSLELTGVRNAVAGTMMAIFAASINVPITLMTSIDGRAHDAHGLRGMMFTDAGVSLATLLLLSAVLLPLLERWMRRRTDIASSTSSRT